MYRPNSTVLDSRALYFSGAGLLATPSIGILSTGHRRSRSAPRARSPSVCARHAGQAGSWAPQLPIRHRSDCSGNEGHYDPQLAGVRASNRALLSRIKRPLRNHIRSSDSLTSRIGSDHFNGGGSFAEGQTIRKTEHMAPSLKHAPPNLL